MSADGECEGRVKSLRVSRLCEGHVKKYKNIFGLAFSKNPVQ